MAKKDDDRASRPDDENPEWTAADFKKARPALTVFAETFGPEAAEAIKNRGGRPVKADKKVRSSFLSSSRHYDSTPMCWYPTNNWVGAGRPA
jgi:uncharacterized protein (DUF4415 family)